MVKIKLLVASLAIAIYTLSMSPQLHAEGWTWNPFSSKSDSKINSPIYKDTTKSSSSNSWWPSWGSSKSSWSKTNQTSSYSKNNASTWQKMSKTSKRWWAKTADVLDPYPDPKPAKLSSTTPPKKSWFDGWGSKSEPKKIENVNDFLGQQRID